MSSNRKVKGAIFRIDIFDHPTYYCAYHQGMSRNKEDAYVYTKDEAAQHQYEHAWALKSEGRWILVYE